MNLFKNQKLVLCSFNFKIYANNLSMYFEKYLTGVNAG